MTGILILIVFVRYLIFHSPAIVMLIIGMKKRKSNPEYAKKLFIAAGIYFLIGTGICAIILTL
jgi:uncharacterized membrane protein YgdD (TMEM256/DUF423 family)